MYNHFLIPLDGSRMAEAPVPAAALLAEKLAARVTLMHVIERNAPSEVHGQTHLKNAADARRYLEQVARLFPADVVVDIHVHEAETDDVAGSIVAHVDELQHDLVIMCSHGRGKALHLLLGSIAQKVIGMGTRPVLITHPDEHGDPSLFACNHILVPLDTDPGHAGALPVSRELARACGASLHLITVIPDFMALRGEMVAKGRMLPGTTSRMLEMAAQEAGEYLQALLKPLQDEHFKASAHVLRGDPATLITEAAMQAQVDMIVLATHGKSGMEAFWAGSVANRICGSSRIPLLLIPIVAP